MTLEKQAAELKKAIERAVVLQRHAQDGDVQLDPLTEEILEELLAATEELQASQEELARQEEALLNANEATRAEQQRYQQLFEFSPDGYIVTDADGLIKMANRVAAQMIGIEPQYLARKPLAIYISLDKRAYFRQQLIQLRRTGAQARWETKLRPRNLPDFDIMLSVAQSMMPTEGKIEFLWQLQDMTEYKQRERGEREQFFRATFEQSPVGMGHIGRNGEWLRVNPKLCELLGYSAEEFQSSSLFDLCVPAECDETRAAFLALVDGETDTWKQERRYVSKNRAIIYALTSVTAIRSLKGEFLYAISVLEDITELKRVEAAEREQRQLAEVLRDTALVLTSSLDFAEVTEHILMNIGGVVPHDAALLLLVDGDKASVARIMGYGPLGETLETDLQDFSLALDESDGMAQMIQTQRPALRPVWDDHGIWDRVPGMADMHSMVATPILDQGDVIGFLELHSRSASFFTPAHANLLQVFAAQAALAIRNARAYQEGQTLAVQDERHRLARDLHDAVTQTLFSANMIIDSLLRLWPEIPDPMETQLQQLQMLTHGALAEMRTLLLELRPESLININLEAQIGQLLDALKVRKRIDTAFINQMEYPIPPIVRVAFYRIAQEALNNVVKHSRATEVRVTLKSEADVVELSVEDNGVGFESSEQHGGLGLSIMVERADEIGADFTLITGADTGTRICVSWGGQEAEEEET